MTTIEQFRNDLYEHRGERKMVIKPQLAKAIRDLYSTQEKLVNWLPGDEDSAFTRKEFTSFFSDIRDHVTHALQNGGLRGSGEPLTLDHNPLDDSAKADSDRSYLIDGASFIFCMNMYIQFYYVEAFAIAHAPAELHAKYIFRDGKLKNFLSVTRQKINWIVAHSTYDPTMSDFNNYGVDVITNRIPTNVLDKCIAQPKPEATTDTSDVPQRPTNN